MRMAQYSLYDSFQTQYSIFCIFALFFPFYHFLSLFIKGVVNKNNFFLK
jgi:hypothetical protein